MMPPAGAGRVLMVLTPEQRESIRDEFEQNRDKIRELEQELREARKAAADAGLAKDFNEEELRKKLEAAAKLEIEMTLLRARALSKIEPPLSDEQIERIKNPPAPGEMMRERRQEQARPNPPAARPPSDQPIPRVPRDGQRPPQQF